MASLDARLTQLEKCKPTKKLPFKVVISQLNEDRAEVLGRIGRPAEDITLWIVLVRDGKKPLLLEQLH